MVKEFSTALHLKHLLLTEVGKDLKHGAEADAYLAAFNLSSVPPSLEKSLFFFSFPSF